jgi:dephospho-CoA kinase
MALVIGLTGGIGSGKTAVASAFASLGVPIVDTDAIAHELSAPGAPGQRAVAAAFGPSAVSADGALNRDWLRQQAFSDPTFRGRLEAILHPLIRSESERRIAAWKAPCGLFVVPLLLERGGRERVDRVLVVDCPEAVQVRRVMKRSGLTEDEVRAIMAAQLPREARLAQADDVIDNGGSPDAIAPQVATLDARYRALAADDASAPPARGELGQNGG